MKTKTKSKTESAKPAKLADLAVRKNPKGGAQKREANRGPGSQHNETFLADQ
jgi:hypothetical protein